MKAIHDHVSGLSPKLEELTDYVRYMIISAIPGVCESVQYNVPFYYYNGPFCYVNIGEDRVSVVFNKSELLEDKNRVLEMNELGGKSLVLNRIDQYDKKLLLDLLIEAVQLNES